MSNRHALLIGVPEYDSDAIPDIPIIRNDLSLLQSSLESSGFTVKSIGTNGALECTKSKILQFLSWNSKTCGEADVLLIYFSGHGIHYQGKDYLVPWDASFDDPERVEAYLLSTDISAEVERSKAKTIIFIVDACREGVKLGSKEVQLFGWNQREQHRAKDKTFLIVFACHAGQVSQYIEGEHGFSLFTKAIAESIGPESPYYTIEDILEDAQMRLNALVTEYNKKEQIIRYSVENSVGKDVLSLPISEGNTNNITEVQEINPWLKAVQETSFFQQITRDSTRSASEFEKEIIALVEASWQLCRKANEAFPQDTWYDQGLPVRVLGALELLVVRSKPEILLSDAEVALLLVVPFIREAILACGIKKASRTDVLSCNMEGSVDKYGQAIHKTFQKLPRFYRKASSLHKQGHVAEKDAVLVWLIYQCLFNSLETWQSEEQGGYITRSYFEGLDACSNCESQLVSESLSRARLIELAYCMFADFERIDRDDRPGVLSIRKNVGAYRNEQAIREKMLAYLLKLAAMLAVDARMLSDVLVDHIGLSDPLLPEHIAQTIKDIKWLPSGQGRIMSVVCSHPAVDLALRQHVEDIDVVLSHILRQVGEDVAEMDALDGIPQNIFADKIVAEAKGNKPTYQLPHVNFSLVHDEIRELLMGEQLYGDPVLAIREMYQNALDACRYRRARTEFLAQTSTLDAKNESWKAKIVFRQMRDDKGRTFIECEDNGIGMGAQHLESCFAKAGRRFSDLPEFIEEQAEWAGCDPPITLYPNSQFGVGVLSYFMLADEVEVETCRMNRDGSPGELLQVRIPGSSGLFRIQRLGKGRKAGTRIRLYLNRTRHEGKLISCIEALRKLLWVAEFDTEAHHFGRREVWLPGELKHPNSNYSSEFCVKAKDADVWWVPEEYYWQKNGCILSDGLWTREDRPGYVVNLHSQYLPKLTVDRKEIIEYDRTYVKKRLLESIDDLLSWQGLDLKLIWKLSKENPKFANLLIEGLYEKDAVIPLDTWNFDTYDVPVQEAGCYDPDIFIIQSRYGISLHEMILYRMPPWLAPYRLLVWQNLGWLNLYEACLDDLPKFCRAEYWPKIKPGDSILLVQNYPPERYLFPGIEGNVPPAHIIHGAFVLGEPLIEVVKRLDKFTNLGLTLPDLDRDALLDIEVTEDDVIAFSIEIKDTLISDLSQRVKPWRRVWPKEKISIGQLVMSSVRLGEGVSETLKRFSKFEPIGVKVPIVESENLAQLTITPEDLIILGDRRNEERARRDDNITPIDILKAAQRLNEPVTQIYRRFKRYIPLGLNLPIEDERVLDNFVVSDSDLVFQKIIEDEIWAFDEYVSVAEIVRVTGRTNESVYDTLMRLKALEPLGLRIRDYPFEDLSRIEIDRDDLTLFSHNHIHGYHHKKDSWSDNIVRPGHLVRAATSLSVSIKEVISKYSAFKGLGLIIPDYNIELLEDLVSSDDDLIAMSKTLTKEVSSSHDIFADKVHPVQVLLAAFALKESVHKTYKRFQRFAPALGLILPEGEPQSWTLR